MKTSSKLILGAVGIIAIGAITYRMVNTVPSETLPENARVLEILKDGGCAECHTANPDLPFYANWPIAKTMITEDIVEGYKAFDIVPTIEALEKDTAINEVDLAKIEKTIIDGTMPLMKYYVVHWGSSIIFPCFGSDLRNFFSGTSYFYGYVYIGNCFIYLSI